VEEKCKNSAIAKQSGETKKTNNCLACPGGRDQVPPHHVLWPMTSVEIGGKSMGATRLLVAFGNATGRGQKTGAVDDARSTSKDGRNPICNVHVTTERKDGVAEESGDERNVHSGRVDGDVAVGI
jgi:hypothetical protein